MNDYELAVQEILDRLDRNQKMFSVVAAYSPICQVLATVPETEVLSPHVLAERMAFAFSARSGGEESEWRTCYGPLAVWTNKEGLRVTYPDLSDIDTCTLDYWSRRAGEVNHPVLRGRYADLVWEFSTVVRGYRRPHELACLAIDSALSLPALEAEKLVELEVLASLRRALSLALAIKDKDRVLKARDTIIAYEKRLSAADELLALWGFAYDLVVEDKHVPKTAEIELEIVAALEARLQGVAGPGKDIELRLIAAQSAVQRLAGYYARKGLTDDLRRVVVVFASICEGCSADDEMRPGAGSIWLQRAHGLLCQYGFREEADRVYPRMVGKFTDLRRTMPRQVHRVTIPTDQIEAFVSDMAAVPAAEAMVRIARYFLPDKEKMIEEVVRFAAEMPLTYSVFTSVISGPHGLPTAVVGTIEEDLEGHIVQHITLSIRVAAALLRAVFDRLSSNAEDYVASVLGYLRECPVYDASSLHGVEVGLRHFLSGKDYASAIYVWMPQIERVLRNAVTMMGGISYRPSAADPRVFDFKTLGTLLVDPLIQSSYGADICLYLRILLVDRRGLNFRNDLLHGLVPADSVDVAVADRVLHAILLLGLARWQPTEEPAGGESGGAATNDQVSDGAKDRAANDKDGRG